MMNHENQPISITLSPAQVDGVVREASQGRAPSVLTLTVLLNSTVRGGSRQVIVVRTLPNAAVTMTVTYPDGSVILWVSSDEILDYLNAMRLKKLQAGKKGR